ncbi:MAG: arginase family protein [Bdellovibrionales bacterium]|nr:arginase family protein [Bdellovibrionales bacterium]
MGQTSTNAPQYYLYGVPHELGCRYGTAKGPGSQQGPAAIRDAYSTLFAQFHVDQNFRDEGDIADVNSVNELLEEIEDKVSNILEAGHRSILLGGAHTLTLGSVRAVSRYTSNNFSLLYFDAHPDIMPREEVDYGSTLYHAISEGVLDPKKLVYFAIRQIEEEEISFIRQKGIRYYTPQSLLSLSQTDIHQLANEFSSPAYVSIDLDVVDPGIAPGVSTPYPLGIDPREIIRILEPFLLKGILGFELVEVAPNYDISEQTSRLAAALLHQITARHSF